jgi:hypothetical protein
VTMGYTMGSCHLHGQNVQEAAKDDVKYDQRDELFKDNCMSRSWSSPALTPNAKPGSARSAR